MKQPGCLPFFVIVIAIASLITGLLSPGHSETKQAASKTTLPPAIKILGAKTYSENHKGGLGAKTANKVRVFEARIQLSKEFSNLSFQNIDENVDEGTYTLQDNQGRHYLTMNEQSMSYGPEKNKNNVIKIWCMYPYVPIPKESQNSLRFIGEIFLYNKTSGGKAVDRRWLVVPVKYFS